MLVRSASSRRRRASRSAASTPQNTNATIRNSRNSAEQYQKTEAMTGAANTNGFQVDEPCRSRSRRASVAAGIGGSVPLLVCNRSPRNSIAVPLGSESNLLSSGSPSRSSRTALEAPEEVKSAHAEVFGGGNARCSFSDGFNESTLVSGNGNGNGSRCSRNSFSVTEIDSYQLGSRSARGSFSVAETSTDLLLLPQGTRSARGSFSCPNSEIQIPVPGSRSARASFSVPSNNQELLLPMNRTSRTDRSSRTSLILPEIPSCLSPRNSLVPESMRSPRGSIVSDVLPNRSPRGSVHLDNFNRSPRASISSEVNRSPRGSITDYVKCSKNAFEQEPCRSRRSSLGTDGMPFRSPRTSPRGSVPDSSCSPRGSLAASNLQISPRGSVDHSASGLSKGIGMTTLGGQPYRLATRATNQVDTESRRASSSISQVSVDDKRKLCEQTKLNTETGAGLQVYGSVVYQLKDANMEASGTCDFVLRALRVVFKTVSVTIILVCLLSLPIIMLIMGVNYLRDCPKEPHLPVYMIVGGSFGTIKMVWIIWRQIKSRRYERLDIVRPQASSNYEDTLLTAGAGSRIASFAFSLFLIVWFILGNFWTLRIYLPDFEPELYDPNKWCSKPLYVFSLMHLAIVHFVIAAVLVLAIVFMCCHTFSCPLVVRYK